VTATAAPDLNSYDIIVLNISGGKDSQVMMRRVLAEAVRQGFPMERVTSVFADLGEDDEWASTAEMDAANGTSLVKLFGDRPGAAELAQMHAEIMGVRYEVVRRVNKDGIEETLTEHVEARGMWPDLDARYCTSDMKRAPVSKLITKLCGEVRAATGQKVVRVLNCMGLRAAESPARLKMVPLYNDKRQTGKGTVKVVDVWLPVHEMSTPEVWAAIRESGDPYAWTYDAGLQRLSCKFCPLAGKSHLVRAAQLDPAGIMRRAEQEERMGHTFQKKTTAIEIAVEADTRGPFTAETYACPAEDYAA
jgi:3'-phosphoadenosine 5'-phosphosulfate sulfotransferase (PAPS reductase)/FAD synthetase